MVYIKKKKNGIISDWNGTPSNPNKTTQIDQ